jgi:hypothetical protein
MSPFNINSVNIELPEQAANISKIINELPDFTLPEPSKQFPTTLVITVVAASTGAALASACLHIQNQGI